jgi:hypothetical protein
MWDSVGLYVPCAVHVLLVCVFKYESLDLKTLIGLSTPLHFTEFSLAMSPHHQAETV